MLETILEFLVQGIVLGGLYALFAVGLTLIFGVLDVINVAHGEFFAIGGYLAFVAIVVIGLPAAALPSGSCSDGQYPEDTAARVAAVRQPAAMMAAPVSVRVVRPLSNIVVSSVRASPRRGSHTREV